MNESLKHSPSAHDNPSIDTQVVGVAGLASEVERAKIAKTAMKIILKLVSGTLEFGTNGRILTSDLFAI